MLKKITHILKLISVLCLFSCSDSYTLNVEVEADQKYFFVFNTDTTYPSSSFSKTIDIENDQFKIAKIKYIPIQKWETTRESEEISSWGQAGIDVKITKSSGFLSSSEIIFHQFLDNFYNPNITNITLAEENEVRKYNPDLDSGLGDSQTNNSFNWISFKNDQLKDKIGSISNFRHTLVKKYSPDIRNHKDFSDQLDDINSRFTDPRTQLFTSNIRNCMILFPYKPEN